MQFLVPQFIDVEPKIFGPISVRQFLILAVTGGAGYLFYVGLPLAIAAPVDVLLAGFGFAFAFLKINSQPLHLFMLSFIRTFRKPKIKVWQKNLAGVKYKKPPKEDEDAKTAVKGPAPEKVADLARLEELTLILDTGGTYRGEEERELKLPTQTAKAPKQAPTAGESGPPGDGGTKPPGFDGGAPGQ